jgi:response regulator RpfG family c-di-GMP phosphodiesterase
LRLLLVDDDAALRALVRTTFEAVDLVVEEAENAREARRKIVACRPDAIVLDVLMPGESGLDLCRSLKSDPATAAIPIVLLSGSDGGTLVAADAAGADAYVRKPFSPLELLSVADRLAGGLYGVPFRATKKRSDGPQAELLLYARDLRHLLELERGQRELLQNAYMETVSALASALESKDTGTRAHSQRVQSYATALANAVGDAGVVRDRSTPYGFLLHDVGKIGIPDGILQKPGPLSAAERRRMQTHTVLGEAMLSGVAFLQGEGLKIVRSHHERWDGRGYPDSLSGDEIPLGARIFAVADALDAMTSHRRGRRLRHGRGRSEDDPAGAGGGLIYAVVRSGLRAHSGPEGDSRAHARVRAGRDRAARDGLGPRAPLSA